MVYLSANYKILQALGQRASHKSCLQVSWVVDNGRFENEVSHLSTETRNETLFWDIREYRGRDENRNNNKFWKKTKQEFLGIFHSSSTDTLEPDRLHIKALVLRKHIIFNQDFIDCNWTFRLPLKTTVLQYLSRFGDDKASLQVLVWFKDAFFANLHAR